MFIEFAIFDWSGSALLRRWLHNSWLAPFRLHWPCQMVAPIVEELAQEYQGRLKVMKLNTDEAPEVAGKYQIMSIPSILFFKGGEVVEKIVGARPKQQFKEIIDTLLSQSSATA